MTFSFHQAIADCVDDHLSPRCHLLGSSETPLPCGEERTLGIPSLTSALDSLTPKEEAIILIFRDEELKITKAQEATQCHKVISN